MSLSDSFGQTKKTIENGNETEEKQGANSVLKTKRKEDDIGRNQGQKTLFAKQTKRKQDGFLSNINIKKNYIGNEIEDSLENIIEVQERLKHIESYRNENILGSNESNLSSLALIYFILCFSELVVPVVIKIHEDISLPGDRKILGVSVPDFYELSHLCPFIFHILKLSQALLACIIIFSIYSTLINTATSSKISVQQYQVPYSLSSIRAYFTLAFLSQFIQILLAYSAIQTTVSTKVGMTFFLAYTSTFVVSGALYVIDYYRLIISYDDEYTKEQKQNWLGIKIVLLLYILMLVIVYVIAYLDIDRFTLYTEDSSTSTFRLILITFPYFIQLCFGLFVVSLYNDLKMCSFGIFSETNQNEVYFDKSNKNVY